MGGCLILMPVLFRGGSEKQIRLVIDKIEDKNLPLTVVVESSDESLASEEKEYVDQHPNTRFVFLKTDALDAKFNGRIKKYDAKFKSLLSLIKAIRKEVKTQNLETAMVTNLTGLVLLPIFRQLNCQVIYNERNPGVKVCSSSWKRSLLKKCKKVVCNSAYASSYMGKALGRNVEVINNGIQQIDMENVPLGDGVFRIIVPARVSEIKNQMVLLKAVRSVREKINVKVIFAGVIEDSKYYEALQAYIKEQQIEGSVEFIGFTSDIKAYYRSSNLLVLPSLEEGTPNVLLEAFMCRLPALASNIPMNADCMQYEKCLFDSHDHKKLAHEIMMIHDMDTEEKRTMTEENYQFAKNNYDIKKMQNRYLELLYQK